ncbi:alpha/beta hydrolase fold domain-containing protein [Candidatus Berkiella aquae]|uniref:Alpha/beta hydrolase fold domain-containing protein n=1 Tax=Candidatus Berkiella aquae TaxID=295108 RepID=A0A0Q9YXK0_9GAMM|nr:alpha/beta hydrolase [Candidatus Berkiella aquae]MCS5711344.1 alpha/beta hydrolase fold domain-containing protein [Candidatus Berkiella aquae]
MPLHPVIARIVRHAYAKGHASLHLQSLEAVREHYRQQFQAPKGTRQGEEFQAKGCRVRLHRPLGQENTVLPLIIYLRASGYSIGDLNDADFYAERLADYTQCAVAALEPRLSPEYKFPIPILDCIDGIVYLHDNHQVLKINPQKIALWGDSSGGTYAAAIVQLLKNEKIIQQQILFYPMLDYYHDYPSKKLYSEGYLLDKTLCDWFISNLCHSINDYQDPRISPVLAEDFSHLPRTTIIGAQYDRMRDEGMAYFDKLVAAKVPVNAVYFPGMIHGFLWYSGVIDVPNMALKYAANQVVEGFKC